MSKKPMLAGQPRARRAVRKTREQLKTAVWPDQAAALADLKASRVPAEGEDYALAEFRPGSWQLVMRDGSGEERVDVTREQRVIDSLRKKPGAKSRTEPTVILEARAKGKAKRSERAVKAPPTLPEPPLGTSESLFALSDSPALPANPYEPLAGSDGPYEVVIQPGPKTFTNAGVIGFVIQWSKRIKCPMQIRNATGQVLREIDALTIKAAGRDRGRPAKNGAPRGVGKSAEAAKLFMREQGATFAEVVKVTEWGISERFVNRLAKANRCSVEKLGEKNYRLIKI